MNIGKPLEIIQAEPAPEPIPSPIEIEVDADRMPDDAPALVPTEPVEVEK